MQHPTSPDPLIRFDQDDSGIVTATHTQTGEHLASIEPHDNPDHGWYTNLSTDVKRNVEDLPLIHADHAECLDHLRVLLAEHFNVLDRTAESSYGWIITADHVPSDVVPDRTGTTGPANLDQATADRLRDGAGTEFRLVDSDDELIYSGRFIGDVTSDDAFGPLDDFGKPDAGCTEVQYLRTDGTWEQIP